MATRIRINKDIINWAILRAGFNLKVFYKQFPKVKEWVGGFSNPTIKQLEQFANKVYVPFGYLLLEKIPEEDIGIPFFRSGTDGRDKKKVSLNVFETIQILKERQDWLAEYLKQLEYKNLLFVGRFTMNDNYKIIAEDIKHSLGFEPDKLNHLNSWEEVLDYLISLVEEKGIFVVRNGVVGNNTNRLIPVEECRGFTLIDKYVPFLFINASDAKAAQMFTLIHELAHVWIGQSAGFNQRNLLPANHPIELLCDQVAAEFLVPEKELLIKWNENKSFNALSRQFKVSSIVVARRALDLNLIPLNRFLKFYKSYMKSYDDIRLYNAEEGNNFYKTSKKRINVRFAFYVNKAVQEGVLLYRDAYRLTDLKGDVYHHFINKYIL